MYHPSRKSLILSLFLLAPLAPSKPALACIWPYQEPAYWREFPAGPERDALLGGQVGILDNDWSDAGLYVAWRHFQGLGLPKESWEDFRLAARAAEEAEILAMTAANLEEEARAAAETRAAEADPEEEAAEPAAAAQGAETAEPAEEPQLDRMDAVGRWQAAVKRAVPQAEPPWVSAEFAGDVPDGKGGTQWLFFPNCLDPAFDTAVAALDRRRERWGQASRELAEWLRGQNQVFANCGQLGESPAELDASWPAELRADRQYQIAAADFYGMRYEAAGERFRRIAADKSSPWAAAAAFSAARTTLRRGLYAQAVDELRAVAKNPALSEFHASAGRLAEYAELRNDLEKQAARLEKEMGGRQLPPDPAGRLYDVRWISRQLEPSPSRPLIYFLQSVSNWKVSAKAAYASWKSSPSVPSLAVALLRASEAFAGNDFGREEAEPAEPPAEGEALFGKAESEALVAAAAKVEKGSPAYLTARYYRADLLIHLGRPDEARQELDRLLAEKVGIAADVQQLRHLRAHLARDWKELIEFGLLDPIGETDSEGHQVFATVPATFNRELAGDARLLIPVAAGAINRFASLAQLAELQRDARLPERYRRELALIGFLRAALKGKAKEAAGFAAAAVAIEPDLQPLFAEWRAAPDADRQKFAAALLMLRQPGLSIDLWPTWGRNTPLEEMDSGRQNWWCDATELPADSDRPTFLQGKEAPEDAGFGWLSGPNHVGRMVLDYAKKYPDDPRLPEALHRTVRATRFGCFGSPFGEVSKGAFELLHKRFPKSEWAAKTKYWFE